MQLAVQFKHDLPGVGAGPANVPVAVMRELTRLPRFEVVAVQVEHAGAVGVEIDGVADPHGIPVGARIVGDLDQCRMLEIEDVKNVRPAALIALFTAEIAPQG